MIQKRNVPKTEMSITASVSTTFASRIEEIKLSRVVCYSKMSRTVAWQSGGLTCKAWTSSSFIDGPYGSITKQPLWRAAHSRDSTVIFNFKIVLLVRKLSVKTSPSLAKLVLVSLWSAGRAHLPRIPAWPPSQKLYGRHGLLSPSTLTEVQRTADAAIGCLHWP